MVETILNAGHREQFLLAGKAVFTVVSKKTGVRFTYKIKSPKDGGIFFVSLLSGPDNTANYSYMGFIRDNRLIHGGMKSRVGLESKSWQAFQWFWNNLSSDMVEVYHSNHCGRCGRALTVPESIITGLGPECVKMVA